MRKHSVLMLSLCTLLLLSATSCQKVKSIFGGGKKSSTTGWAYNNAKNGGFEDRKSVV